MRAFKHTTTYPAFKHTSFNLEHRGRTTATLSFHIRHGYADRGFWLGLRPEIEVHRDADRMEKLSAEMRTARSEFTCWRCGRKEWGEPGLRHPEDWDFIQMLDFCGDCTRSCSYHDLLNTAESGQIHGGSE